MRSRLLNVMARIRIVVRRLGLEISVDLTVPVLLITYLLVQWTSR